MASLVVSLTCTFRFYGSNKTAVATCHEFILQYCAGNRTMPFLLQMKGLRRNEAAMKTDAGITFIQF